MKRIFAANSSDAEKFKKLYESVQYSDNPKVFDSINKILELYADEDEIYDLYDDDEYLDVGIIFDRAAKSYGQFLLQQAQKLTQSNTDKSSKNKNAKEAKIRRKFSELENKYDRDNCDEYELGYFEALCDFADAFGIQLR